MDSNYLLLVLISLFFSALFSGMEIAFVSANRLQIELQGKQGKISGKILAGFIQNPGQFIGTSLMGNTISLVLYGIFMAYLLEPPLSLFYRKRSIHKQG